MTVLLTGAAGFIGYHVAEALLARGERVVGVDNMNPYYDVKLKAARRDRLLRHAAMAFHEVDLADRAAMEAVAGANPDIRHVIHLAAQAGVRYSIENPFAYVQSNLVGHVVVLELCRRLPRLEHLLYASSSSVYGGNTKLPFSVDDPVERPVSLYAATKRADELMTHAYSHLYGFPATGLRFFTVYGPWGRPDMAAFLFTKAIFENKPIKVFNHGDMQRDFTYVDDIVKGVLACRDHPPQRAGGDVGGDAPHRVYNLGNNNPEPLLRFISVVERATNRKAVLEMLPMQAGDVQATYADIEASTRDFGFVPSTQIDEGVPRFVDWYRQYYGA